MLKKIRFIFVICTVMLSTLSTNSMASVANDKLEALLAQHKGSVIYLDFWASWCGPCQKSFPWMNNMVTKYQDKGLVVLSVNVDAQPELAAKFLIDNPVNFPVVYDSAAIIADKYKLKGMPSSYVFGRDGTLKTTHVGFITSQKPRYESQLVALLAQK
jgi:thiol-disulfide isomerase/thioredoxin